METELSSENFIFNGICAILQMHAPEYLREAIGDDFMAHRSQFPDSFKKKDYQRVGEIVVEVLSSYPGIDYNGVLESIQALRLQLDDEIEEDNEVLNQRMAFVNAFVDKVRDFLPERLQDDFIGDLHSLVDSNVDLFEETKKIFQAQRRFFTPEEYRTQIHLAFKKSFPPRLHNDIENDLDTLFGRCQSSDIDPRHHDIGDEMCLIYFTHRVKMTPEEKEVHGGCSFIKLGVM